ncbi:hypothetical protein NL676_025037 [Syzygium grande]|nr:hypothetical protein NL676_025037 [Syzygium grande]
MGKGEKKRERRSPNWVLFARPSPSLGSPVLRGGGGHWWVVRVWRRRSGDSRVPLRCRVFSGGASARNGALNCGGGGLRGVLKKLMFLLMESNKGHKVEGGLLSSVINRS